jgi:hypothetical protein
LNSAWKVTLETQ